MGNREIELLQDRVRRLDDRRLPVVSFDADRRLLHFITVMMTFTHTTMGAEPGGQAIVAPAEADEIAATCRLLGDIAGAEPELVTGPVVHRRQHWIGTSRQAPAPGEIPRPTRSRFVSPADMPSLPPSTKPFGLGLYTSTVTRQGISMWRTYLDLFYGSGLYPLPWYTWELRGPCEKASVLEITTAQEWAVFVEAYAMSARGMIYPDWRKVAAEFDGVHLTLRAIVAMQGFNFPTARGTTAAGYFDVESTLWLHWHFTGAHLSEITNSNSRAPQRPSVSAEQLPRPPPHSPDC